MTVTLDNFSDFHIKLDLGHHKIHFFAFNDRPLAETRGRIAEMRAMFDRLPRNHPLGIAPIFLLKERPLGGHGGGTYPNVENLRARRPAVAAQRAEAWGAPIEVLVRVIDRYGRFGGTQRYLHVIPLADWDQPGRATTVIHECTHGIDMTFNLHKRASADPLRPGPNIPFDEFPARLAGQACGHGSELNRRAVNAYVSMITGFRGVRTADRRRIIEAFRSSHGFNGVPESWWQTNFPEAR